MKYGTKIVSGLILRTTIRLVTTTIIFIAFVNGITTGNPWLTWIFGGMIASELAMLCVLIELNKTVETIEKDIATPKTTRRVKR
jgi:hypothetical protein